MCGPAPRCSRLRGPSARDTRRRAATPRGHRGGRGETGPHAHGAARPRRGAPRGPDAAGPRRQGARVGGDVAAALGDWARSTPTGTSPTTARTSAPATRTTRTCSPPRPSSTSASSWSRPLARRRSSTTSATRTTKRSWSRPRRRRRLLRLAPSMKYARRLPAAAYAALVAQQHAPAAALRCVLCGAVRPRAGPPSVAPPPLDEATPADRTRSRASSRHRRARSCVDYAKPRSGRAKMTGRGDVRRLRRRPARLGRRGRASLGAGFARRAGAAKATRRSGTGATSPGAWRAGRRASGTCRGIIM